MKCFLSDFSNSDSSVIEVLSTEVLKTSILNKMSYGFIFQGPGGFMTLTGSPEELRALHEDLGNLISSLGD